MLFFRREEVITLDMDVESDGEEQGQWSAEEIGPGEENEGQITADEKESEEKRAGCEEVASRSDSSQERQVARADSAERLLQDPEDVVVVDPVICGAEEREVPTSAHSEEGAKMALAHSEVLTAQDKSEGYEDLVENLEVQESDSDKRIGNSDVPAVPTSVKSVPRSVVTAIQYESDINKDNVKNADVESIKADFSTCAERNMISGKASQTNHDTNVKNIIKDKSQFVSKKANVHPEPSNRDKIQDVEKEPEINTQQELSARQQQHSVELTIEQQQMWTAQQQQLPKIPVEWQSGPPARQRLPAAAASTEAGAAMAARGTAGGCKDDATAGTSCKICSRQYTARRDFYRNRTHWLTSVLVYFHGVEPSL